MSDKPVIIDFETKLCSGILQPLFDMVWDGLGETPAPDDVRDFIGAFELPPSTGDLYVGLDGAWEILTPANLNLQWGDVGGALSNQTDLQDALNLKADITYVDSEVSTLQGYVDAADALLQADVDSKVASVVAGTNITVDNTDPQNPIVSTGTGLSDAPADDGVYARLNNTWTDLRDDFLDAKAGRRNALINGCFRIWQRTTSQTSSGYGSDDRWVNANVGSSKTHSRQGFTIGQTDVPGNPDYYSRTAVTSVSDSSYYCYKSQRIEGVETFSGETVTLSFYAKADASKNIAVEFVQNFGTTGSPSSTVDGIGSQLVALTTSWAKYTVTVSIPSISGKTLGDDGNDYLELRFWFDAGSTYDANTASLGQQSGTFDLAQVQLELGSAATDFERRPIGKEITFCERYFQKTYDIDVDPGTTVYGGCFSERQGGANIQLASSMPLRTRMRTAPSVVSYSPDNGVADRIYNVTGSANTAVNAYAGTGETTYARQLTLSSAPNDNNIITWQMTADAEL